MSRRPFRLSLSFVLVVLAVLPLATQAALPTRVSRGEAFGGRSWSGFQVLWDRIEAAVLALRLAPGAGEGDGKPAASVPWSKEGGSWDPNGSPRPASSPVPPAGENGGSWDPNGRP